MEGKSFHAGTEAEIGSWQHQRQTGIDGLTGTDDVDIASHTQPRVGIREVGGFFKSVFPCSSRVSRPGGSARKKAEIEVAAWGSGADQNRRGEDLWVGSEGVFLDVIEPIAIEVVRIVRKSAADFRCGEMRASPSINRLLHRKDRQGRRGGSRIVGMVDRSLDKVIAHCRGWGRRAGIREDHRKSAGCGRRTRILGIAIVILGKITKHDRRDSGRNRAEIEMIERDLIISAIISIVDDDVRNDFLVVLTRSRTGERLCKHVCRIPHCKGR